MAATTNETIKLMLERRFSAAHVSKLNLTSRLMSNKKSQPQTRVFRNLWVQASTIPFRTVYLKKNL